MKHPGSHILIVDDEEQLAETFKDALEDSGYVCYTAACGEAALQILNTEAVDLALLDIMMPGMSGISLFHEMKEQYPEVATIFITAVDDLGTVVSKPQRWGFRLSYEAGALQAAAHGGTRGPLQARDDACRERGSRRPGRAATLSG